MARSHPILCVPIGGVMSASANPARSVGVMSVSPCRLQGCAQEIASGSMLSMFSKTFRMPAATFAATSGPFGARNAITRAK